MPDLRVFEVGHVFSPHREGDGDRPAHEELWVGIALTGLRQPRAWHAGRDRVDVYDAKGAAALALGAAGAGALDVVLEPAGGLPGYLEPGRAAGLATGGIPLGWFGEITPEAREAFDLAAPVYLAELSLSAVAALALGSPRYEPLPRYPSVQRDLALVVGAGVAAGEIEAALRAMAIPWLVRVQLFDVYTGDQVGSGRRSLAWSLTFQAPERTLTDAEVNEVHARVIKELTERFRGEVRGSP
jgi:phenylalanyl-tRNA synthetase beta chain